MIQMISAIGEIRGGVRCKVRPVFLRHHVNSVLVVCRGHPGQSPVHRAPVRVGHVVVPVEEES